MRLDFLTIVMSVSLVASIGALAMAPPRAAAPKSEEPDVIRVFDAGAPSAVTVRRATLLTRLMAPKQDGGFPMLDVRLLFQSTEADYDSAVLVLRNTETDVTTVQIFLWRPEEDRWVPVPEAYR